MIVEPQPTIAVTFTAGELFALQQALISAQQAATDEARAQRELAYLAGGPNGTSEAVTRHLLAYDAATERADLYLELASRIGHRASELPEDVPEGFGAFPRRAAGGLL